MCVRAWVCARRVDGSCADLTLSWWRFFIAIMWFCGYVISTGLSEWIKNSWTLWDQLFRCQIIRSRHNVIALQERYE